MKIIRNNFIPFRGFKAINIMGICFVRSDAKRMLPYEYQHEKIHTAQIKELWYIGFYIIYLFEWVFRLFQCKFSWIDAYHNVTMERECYENQHNYKYLETRKPFAMWRKIHTKI